MLAQLRPLANLTRGGKTELKMAREYPRELVVFLVKEGWRVADIASVLQAGGTFVRKIKRIFETNQSVTNRFSIAETGKVEMPQR